MDAAAPVEEMTFEQALAEPADPERMRARAVDMAGPAMVARYAELLSA